LTDSHSAYIAGIKGKVKWCRLLLLVLYIYILVMAFWISL